MVFLVLVGDIFLSLKLRILINLFFVNLGEFLILMVFLSGCIFIKFIIFLDLINLVVGMEIRMYKFVLERFFGKFVKVGLFEVEVILEIIEEMVVDEYGFVYGGFMFGLVDYVVMLVVNELMVVFGKVEVRFFKFVKVGERFLVRIRILENLGGGVGDGMFF